MAPCLPASNVISLKLQVKSHGERRKQRGRMIVVKEESLGDVMRWSVCSFGGLAR